MEAVLVPPPTWKIQAGFYHHDYYSCKQQSAVSLKAFVPPPQFVLLSQVSAEPEGGSYVFQGFVQGKDYGRFGLQRVGRCRATGLRLSAGSFVESRRHPPTLTRCMR